MDCSLPLSLIFKSLQLWQVHLSIWSFDSARCSQKINKQIAITFKICDQLLFYILMLLLPEIFIFLSLLTVETFLSTLKIERFMLLHVQQPFPPKPKFGKMIGFAFFTHSLNQNRFFGSLTPSQNSTTLQFPLKNRWQFSPFSVLSFQFRTLRFRKYHSNVFETKKTKYFEIIRNHKGRNQTNSAQSDDLSDIYVSGMPFSIKFKLKNRHNMSFHTLKRFFLENCKTPEIPRISTKTTITADDVLPVSLNRVCFRLLW